MADIFDEIDNELKQDRQAVLWQRYGKYLIGGALLIIALVGARQGYVYWVESRDAKAASLYYQAVSADDAGDALQEVQANLTDGYQILAEFSIARKLSEKGRSSEAEAAFLGLAARTDIEPVYRDTALLLSVMHADSKTDSSKLLARLAPLTETAGPLQGLALEQAAGLELKLGQVSKAADKLQQIISLTEIPPTLRQRASQLLTVIAGDTKKAS